MSVETLWAGLRADASGLVVAVITDARDGRVRMVGYMNRDALAATLATGRVTFWSRSRACLWEKGESSGHSLALRSLRTDCDGDALWVEVEARGPTCHTGATSCFFRPLGQDATGEWMESRPDDGPPLPAFRATFDTILERQAGRGSTQREGRSYVRDLLDAGHEGIAAKVLEEAQELTHSIAGESDERVAAEAGDLVFHVMVALAHRGIDLDAVEQVLRGRHGRSGIDEKAGRQSP